MTGSTISVLVGALVTIITTIAGLLAHKSTAAKVTAATTAPPAATSPGASNVNVTPTSGT